MPPSEPSALPAVRPLDTSATVPAPRRPRIQIVDFWRGTAILFILINHLPPSPLQQWTNKPHGFSDTAAWFFLLSGFVARLVYGKMLREKGVGFMASAVARRIGQLYLCHLLLALAFVASSWYLGHGHRSPPWWLAEPAARLAADSPFTALGAALALQLNGFCVNILPTYVVILALFLGTSLLERRFRLPPLVPALALYVLNIAFGPLLFAGWTFNPLSWQLLFHLGGWLFDNRDRLISGGLRTRLVLIAAWGTLLGCALIRHAHDLLPMPWAYWVSLLEPHRGKAMLDWPYLTHSLVTFFALGCLLPDAAIARFAPFRMVAAQGKKPLPLFMITTLVCFAAYCLHGGTIGAPLAVLYLGCGLGLGAAYLRWAKPTAPG